ncbi:MAG: N-acetylmuramoyl-L-alanine amidase [Myxococcota bacterium]
MPSPTFTVQPPTAGSDSEILVMGERVPLGGDVRVITYDRLGAPSFYEADPSKQYFLGRPNVRDAAALKQAIRQVILHTDLTADSHGCFAALVGRSLSTHFMIDFNGDLYQPLDVFECAFQAGQKDINDQSIGVDLNSLLPNLAREPDAKPYPDDHPRAAEMHRPEYQRPKSEWRSINTARLQSYGYTDAQYLALIELLKALTQHFPNLAVAYPTNAAGEVVATTLADPKSFQGFMAHYHVEAQRWDPGPGFDWERVLYALSNEHNSFPIELVHGKNIGNVLDPGKVMALAEAYFRNNEAETRGWYPVGVNQWWHGGIHLACPPGTEVRAMTDGVLVAAHFQPEAPALGSNNFVLLRHEIPIGQRRPGVAPKTLVFYSLYMHLAPLDLARLDEASPRWLRDLWAGGKAQPGDEDADLATSDAHPWLELGEQLAALKRGAVAKIAWRDNPVLVGSGAVLGRSGTFDQDDDGEPKGQIHVEVFAGPGWKDAIDMGVHGKWLVELDDDLGHDLAVEDQELLGVFGPGSRLDARGRMVLDDADLTAFWRDQDASTELVRRLLRKTVARHESEWSDQVDWVLALSQASAWDDRIRDFRKLLSGSFVGKELLTRVLPFVWLSKDLAQHIGLDTTDWRGVLDHFHPIHFLMWLTYKAAERNVTTSQGRSTKSIRDEARAQADVIEAKMKAGRLDDEDLGSSIVSTIDNEGPSDAADLRDWLADRGAGEWQRDPPPKSE